MLKAVARERKNNHTKTEKQPFSGLPFTTKEQSFFKLSTQNLPVPEKVLTVKNLCRYFVFLSTCFVYVSTTNLFLTPVVTLMDNLDHAIGFVMNSRYTEIKEIMLCLYWE